MLALVKENNNKGMKTIFLGDSGQLEPVSKDPKLFLGKVSLEKSTELIEVKRQNLESPVLAVATAIRNKKKSIVLSESVPDFTVHKNAVTLKNKWLDDLAEGKNVVMISQINKVRIASNLQAREKLFGKDRGPIEDGEILISISNSDGARRNATESGVFNGETLGENRDKTYTLLNDGKPIKLYYGQYAELTIYVVKDELGNNIFLMPTGEQPSIYHSSFLFGMTPDQKRHNIDTLKSLGDEFISKNRKTGNYVMNKNTILAYYGYAITGHKSQGSQWENVYVQQDWDGRIRGVQKVNIRKWVYTAITRSSKSVDIYSNTSSKVTLDEVKNIASQVVDVKEETKLPKDRSWGSLLEVAKKIDSIKEDYKNVTIEEIQNVFENDLSQFELYLHQQLTSDSSGIDGMIDLDDDNMVQSLQGEFKEIASNLFAKIAELKRRKTSATSLNARNYIDSQITRLEDDIKKVTENATVATIRHVAMEQLKWAESILDRKTISTNELIDASNIVDVWSYSNSTRYVLSDAQAENKNNPTRKVLEEIGAAAAALETSLASKRLSFAKDQVKIISNETIVNPGESILMLDPENVYITNMIGLTDFQNPLIRTFDSILKDINRAASDNALSDQKELEEKMKEFKAELDRLGLDESILLQKDSEGNLTGHVVSQFSDKYYKDTAALRRKLTKELESIINLNTSDHSKKQKRLNAWQKYFAESRRMELVIDIRFWEVEGHTTKEAKSTEEYVKFLQNELGESAANVLIEQAKEKVRIYKLELQAYENKLAADIADGVLQPLIGRTLSETVDLMIQAWKRRNDPSLYIAHRENPSEINLDSGKYGWKRTIKVPRKNFNNGEYYNNDFKTIESSSVLSSFYAYYTNKLAEYKSYIPEIDEHQLSSNFFPIVEKDIVETYIREGSMAALKKSFKKFGIYSFLFHSDVETLKGQSVETAAQRDVDGNIMPQIPRRFIHDNIEINERSFDIERVLTMFGAMAHNYKAKAAAEPTINLLHRVISDAVETIEDNRGQAKTRPGSSKKIFKKATPEEIMEAVQYARDGMLYGKVREEIKKTSLELPGNLSFDTRKKYKRSKELRKQYKELEEKLNTGEITQEEFDVQEKAMEKEFKGLNIKAFSWNKLMRGLLNYTQLKQLGWNWTAGIANVGFGILASNIHAAGEEDYTAKNLRTAFKLILKSTMSSGPSKAANVMRRLGVLFEMRDAEYGTGRAATKSRFKLLGKLGAMQIQQSTEFVVQGLSGIAKMLNTEVIDLNGNKRNLYEAFDENGDWNTAEFGVQKEWSYENLTYKTRNKYTNFRNSVIEMNKKLHGNYDPNSLVKFKSKDWRLLLTIFRTWMFEGFNTRLSREVKNNQLGRSTKGRYRTYMDIGILNSIKTLFRIQINNLTGGKLEIDGIKNNLDLINMRKNLKEIHMYLTLYGLGLMLKGLAGEEDDEDQRKFTIMYNLLDRIKKDILFYTKFDTFTDLLNNITPVMKTLTDIVKFNEGFKAWMLKEDYRGDHPAWKALKLFPGLNQIPKTNALMEKFYDQAYGYDDYIMDNYFEEDYLE